MSKTKKTLQAASMNSSLTSLPEGFVYPVGYKVRSNRVTDPEILKDFKLFEVPYVVSYKGNACVDSSAPTAVGRLRNGQDSNLKSAIRWLELEGPPDESMQATYNCEDVLSNASDYSEAGFHKIALDLINTLPKPFQETGRALGSLTRSLKAIGRYEEALEKVRCLIAGYDTPTEWALTLHRLDEVHLLMLLGRIEEAEGILNERRQEFRCMYQYYGHRAALALIRGDEALAKALVIKAGRVDHYHCYKILWNPLLKPLEAYIRKELLTKKGEPLLYEQNMELLRISNRIQGALLCGRIEEARNLVEGMILHRATEWSTTYESMLALTGVGAFESVYSFSHILPGSSLQPVMLARMIAAAVTRQYENDLGVLEEFLSREEGGWEYKELLLQASRQLADGKPFKLPNDFELLLFEVALKNWTDNSRELFLVHAVGGKFRLTTLCEPRRKRDPELRGRDLRKVFPVTATRDFSSEVEAQQWIEEKLARNAIPRTGPFKSRPVWMINIDGWSLLTAMTPSEEAPILREAWDRAATDPNFFFQNGPADSFGMTSSYEVRLLQMLSVEIKHHGQSELSMKDS